MSRRKQQKPQALRDEENEESGIISNNLPKSIDNDNDGQFEPKPYSNEDVRRALEQLDACSGGSNSPVETAAPVNSAVNGFSCCYCPNIYDTYSQLKQHEQEHADLMPHRCAFCGRGFKHKRSLDRHVKLHSGIRKYKCHFCKNAFFRSDHLKLHLKTHETSKYPFVCQICQRGYHTSVSLETHMMHHNDEMASANDESIEPQFTTKELEDMIEKSNVTPEVVTVGVKDNVFITHSALQHNVQSEKESHNPISQSASSSSSLLRSYLMPMTSSGTNRLNVSNDIRDNITSLMSVAEDDQPLPVATYKVGQEDSGDQDDVVTNAGGATVGGGVNNNQSQQYVPYQYVTLNHVTQKNTPRMTCSVCSETFSDVDSLQSHTLRKHSLKDLGSSSGNSATNLATNNQNLNGNDDIIDDDPTYLCEECGRNFDSILSLHNHVTSAHANPSSSSRDEPSLSSESPKVYLCIHCNTDFPTLKSYTAHMKLHLASSSRPNSSPMVVKTPASPTPSPNSAAAFPLMLVCQFCGVTCENQSTFETHSMSHYLHKESQYKCSQCSTASEKLFVSREELHKHQLEMHAAFLYRCSICKNIFESRADIQIHFNIMHSSEMIRFRCRSCNSVFPSDEQFRVHLRAAHLHKNNNMNSNHANNDTSSGNLKSLTNGYSSGYTPAAGIYHGNQQVANPFTCPVCFETFSVEYLYDKHMETVHRSNNMGGGNYSTLQHYLSRAPAVVVDHSNSSKNSATHHHQLGAGSSSGNVLVKCNICDERCLSVAELAKHKLLRHCKVVRSEHCNVCKDPVLNAEQFFTHTQRHTSPGTAPACIICKQSMSSLVEMQAHAKFHCEPPSPPPYQPPKSVQNLQMPNSRCHGNQGSNSSGFHGNQQQWSPLKCSKCLVKFETQQELFDHVPICESTTSDPVVDGEHHVTQNGPCDDQSKSASTVTTGGATSSVNGGTNRSYQCIKCQQWFATESEIHAHVASHVINDGLEHKCHLCRQVFDSPLKLQRHLIEHSYGLHTNGQQEQMADGQSLADLELTCFLCNAICKGSAEIQTHLQSSHVTAERPYKCDWCEQKFFFEAELANHVTGSHHYQSGLASNNSHLQTTPSPPPSQTAFVCVMCGIAFNSSSTLKCHAAQCRRKANNSLNLGMGGCGGSTSPVAGHSPVYGQVTLASFLEEQATGESHNATFESTSGLGSVPGGFGTTPIGKRSILAELMSRQSTGPTSSISPYNNQSAMPGDPNAFQCPHCPKAFKSLSALQGHSHVHMNTIKQHQCTKCKKHFQTAAKLRNHQRQHSGDKPFPCEICGRHFSRKDNLKVHLRIHFKGPGSGGGSTPGNYQQGADGGSPDLYLYESMSPEQNSLCVGSLQSGMNSALPTMVVPKLMDFYNGALDIDDN